MAYILHFEVDFYFTLSFCHLHLLVHLLQAVV